MNPMNDMKLQVEVDPNEDTEWNDILRSKGIIPEKPPSPSAELEAALEEAVQKQHDHRLEGLDMDELDALEDDEDEDFLNIYRAKRMEEYKKLAERRFGMVFPVTKNEYEDEITKASKDAFVVVHMSSSSSLQSRLLESIFTTLASKYTEIKFCDIPARRCIENYPESNCPTLIVYHQTNVAKQYITLTQLGGNSATVADIEKVLVDVSAVDAKDKRLLLNQSDEWSDEERKTRFVKKSVRGRGTGAGTGEDLDGDDFYD